MRILMLTHAFNGLSQRLFAELRALGHDVSVELDINDAVTRDAVSLYRPNVILAPFLKRRIPESVWRRIPCLIVHPGVPGDGGPSALDWAIRHKETSWGVTVLQATEELDGGPVWSWASFPMRDATKSSLYRLEVTEAAVTAVRDALERLQAGDRPRRLRAGDTGVRGKWRDPMPVSERRIDWERDDTATVLNRIRCSDGFPGAPAELAGRACRLFDAHAEPGLQGTPGRLLARWQDAVCVATRDSAVWLGMLRDEDASAPDFKLPATRVLASSASRLPECRPETDAAPIRYEEHGAVGYLHFDFYNGALSTARCIRLRRAFRQARRRPTRVIVLMGGREFWSNGMDLNTIEAADSPSEESWRNINAIDDLAHDVLTTHSHLVLSAMQGNAGAGGVFLALAADRVLARTGAVLNPHYRNMGNLFGSEYWTYLLPSRLGMEGAQALMSERLPLRAVDAAAMGLIDDVYGPSPAEFLEKVESAARAFSDPGEFRARLAAKRARRREDEARKPLQAYRREELERMRLNFFGFDPGYHVARFRFVNRVPHAWTPLHLARHRRIRPAKATPVPASEFS